MIEEEPISKLAELFIDTVIKRAYSGAIHDVISILEKGHPSKNPPQDLIALHEWYKHLSPSSQAYILRIIQESVEASVFGFLVVLDGVYRGDPLREHLAEWALYLQRYRNLEAKTANQPETAVKINSIPDIEELHDLFMERLKHPPALGGSS